MKTPDYIVTYEQTPGYLTAGKRYQLKEDFGDELYTVTCDSGVGVIVHVPKCAHLDWGKWKRGYIFHV